MDKIAISKIVFAPWNPRGEISDDSVRSLAQTIERNGLSTPVTLGKVAEDGNTYLVAGHRRVAAARLLGWKDIPFSLVEYATIAEAKIATFNDNDQREDTDPLAKAREIAALLDGGVSVKDVAARMCHTTAWVERMRPIVKIADEAQELVGKVTFGVFERIAAMPDGVRAGLINTAKTRAKYAPSKIGVSDMKYDFERETRDLDEACFDTKKCLKCANRTGAQADLFGDADGKLGKCLDCKCFEKCVKAWEEAKIAEAVPDGAEVVRVEYFYKIPQEANSAKPTKKSPCAYVWFGGDGEMTVKFGPSKKQIEAERAAREAELAEKRRERDADYERECEIGEKFHEHFHAEENHGEVVKALKKCLAKPTKAQVAWIVELVADNWGEVWSERDMAEIMRTFPFSRDLCGVSAEDAKWYADRNAGDGDDK